MSDPQVPPPPPPSAPPAYGAPGAPPPPRGGFPTWGIIAIIVAILVVGGGVAAILLLGGDDEPAPIAVQTTLPPVLDSPSAAPSPIVDSPVVESPVLASPVSTPCTTAPQQPLVNCVPDKVGAYTLTEWDNAPQFAQTFNANTAIEVTFNRGDGSTVQHYLFSYPTHTEATIEKNNYVNGFKATGYTVVGQSREKGINVTRLVGQSEVLVWSNGVLMAVLVGPFDVTTGFFTELPY